MLDLSLLNAVPADVQEWVIAPTPASICVGVWTVPRGAKMCFISAIGRGGAGGSGASAGGGGGGSGAYGHRFFPLFMFPPRLYIMATSTGLSVSLEPTDGVARYMMLQVLDGSAGGNAVTTTIGAAGTGATSSVSTQANSFSPSISTNAAGQNGTAGHATGAATAVTRPTTGIPVTGGGGGAGKPASGAGALGAGITGTGQFIGNPGGAGGASAAASGSPGNPGTWAHGEIPWFLGGSGGGSSGGTSGTGGAGGAGAFGCGGGGGGGGASGSAAGGPGGLGRIVITAW